MSLIFHIIKKDIRRLKWFLLGYSLLVVIASSFNLRYLLTSDNLILSMQLPMLSYLISFLSGLVGIVLVPLLVQEDSLVGTTSFWLTRPIRKMDLLKAKMLFLVSFLVLYPLMLEITVMLINGIALKYIGLAIPEIIIKNTVFIVPALLLATLTLKFSRFAMVGISLYAGFYLLSILWFITNISTTITLWFCQGRQLMKFY